MTGGVLFTERRATASVHSGMRDEHSRAIEVPLGLLTIRAPSVQLDGALARGMDKQVVWQGIAVLYV